jgi:hypothetical protein
LPERAAAVEKVIAHEDNARLIYWQFFPVENAWWPRRALG